MLRWLCHVIMPSLLTCIRSQKPIRLPVFILGFHSTRPSDTRALKLSLKSCSLSTDLARRWAQQDGRPLKKRGVPETRCLQKPFASSNKTTKTPHLYSNAARKKAGKLSKATQMFNLSHEILTDLRGPVSYQPRPVKPARRQSDSSSTSLSRKDE